MKNEKEDLTELSTQIVKELFACGFEDNQLDLVSNTIVMFISDYFKYHYENSLSDDFIEMSKLGLIQLVDLSLLKE